MLAQFKLWGLLGLLIWAVAGPMLTYGATSFSGWLDQKDAVATARREERDGATRAIAAERISCEADKVRVQQELANAQEENRRLADEAEAAVPVTPTEAAAIEALCNASHSCRDRKQGK